MLLMPSNTRPVRVLAIDPGSTTLGVSVIDIDFASRQIVIPYVKTHQASNTQQGYQLFTQIHGNRTSRIHQHGEHIAWLLNTFGADFVACESPFAARGRINAFQALVECVTTVRNVLLDFSPYIPFEVVDPTSVKKHLGIKLGRGASEERKNKLLVQQAILNRPDVTILDPQYIDEHCMDATGVGLYFVDKFLV